MLVRWGWSKRVHKRFGELGRVCKKHGTSKGLCARVQGIHKRCYKSRGRSVMVQHRSGKMQECCMNWEVCMGVHKWLAWHKCRGIWGDCIGVGELPEKFAAFPMASLLTFSVQASHKQSQWGTIHGHSFSLFRLLNISEKNDPMDHRLLVSDFSNLFWDSTMFQEMSESGIPSKQLVLHLKIKMIGYCLLNMIVIKFY